MCGVCVCVSCYLDLFLELLDLLDGPLQQVVIVTLLLTLQLRLFIQAPHRDKTDREVRAAFP